MTRAVSVRTIRPAESRLIAAVCAAHMMSHYYMLLLAPLFVFVRADFKVGYTELALALTVLIVGLAISSLAYAIAGIVASYWVFIAMYGLGGLGNTVFHPSDYSLLSHHAPKDRLSQVFAFHTFAGMVGSGIAPVTLLFMQSYFGWRGAYVGAATLGFIVLFALISQPEPKDVIPTAPKPRQRHVRARSTPGAC
jgi:MFS transporter, FSR family, fosmidomycin resistance protein